jgi:hypothetical protein
MFPMFVEETHGLRLKNEYGKKGDLKAMPDPKSRAEVVRQARTFTLFRRGTCRE